MFAKCTHSKNALISLTFIWTFASFANMHMVRTLWSLSKPQLRLVIGQQKQAYLDTAFLFMYAIGQFVTGLISAKYNQVLFISFGMVSSAVLFCLVPILLDWSFWIFRKHPLCDLCNTICITWADSINKLALQFRNNVKVDTKEN